MKKKSILKICIVLFFAIMFAFTAIYDFGGTSNFSASHIKQGLDLKGGVSITYEAATDTPPTAEEMLSARSLIQARLDRKGYTEAEVAQSGDNRLIVDIPGVEDAEDAVKTIGATAKLSFVDIEGNELLSGNDVKTADVRLQNDSLGQSYVVQLTLNAEGAKKFEDATGNNVGKPLIIMLDDEMISAPTVQQKIVGDTAVITGDFTKESAEELAAEIRSGSLPFSLNTISVKNVGATLGAKALSTSIYAGFIGILLVFIFMLFVYFTFGIVADIALILYVGLVIFFLNLFNVTLTLPGIAGIILSIGMAVDANIIIFERVKEEVQNGRTLRAATKAGFGRAFPAILDGNITTLIAAVILFWLGTGSIKGFAQTLAIGILLSMFTALVITNTLLKSLIDLGVTNKKYFGIKEKASKVFNIDIIANKSKVFILSGVIILAGLVIMFINSSNGNNPFNYDVEFQGGTSYSFDIGKDFENSDIENIIKDTTGQTGTVQKIGGDDKTEVQIKLLDMPAEQRVAFTDALYEFYGIDDSALLSMDVVSPTISSEMRNNAFLAIIVASVAMLLYVSFRFKDIQTGASAIIALVHDISIVTLFYAVFRIPLNYSFIAVILTVLGYSINSTIVIFDRVRENKHLAKRTNAEYINLSVSQTLKRSIYTSITTLLPVLCLYIFGVQSIREFTLPIIVGVIIGTYSSVFLSGSIWYSLSSKKNDKK